MTTVVPQIVRVEPDARQAEVLAEFDARRRAGRYAGLPAHHQPFAEPYVVRHRLCGFTVDVLIANENAMHWYEDPDRVIATAVYCGEFEVAVDLELAREGDVVFDAGAHHGVLSAFYARLVGPAGHVHAFEPSLIGSDLVELNARLNGLENVTAHRAAVGDVAGSGRFSERDARFGLANFDDVEVERVTFDDLAAERPDLLKIDVEGAETRVLAGAQRVLGTTPNLMLELHPRWLIEADGKTPEEALALVDWTRYDVFQAVGKPPYSQVPRPELPEQGGWIAGRRNAAVRRRGRGDWLQRGLAAARGVRPAARPPAHEAETAVHTAEAGGLRWAVTELKGDPVAEQLREGVLPGGVLPDTVLRFLPEGGGRLLDLGAHLGTTALRAAAGGAEVIAVEADEASATALRRSAEASGLGDRVTVVRAAAADRAGRIEFSPCGPWSHVRKVSEVDDVRRSELIETVRGDALAAGRPVDVVKVTVNGFELAALAGLDATPVLVIEADAHALSWYAHDVGELRKALAARGLETFFVDWRRPDRLVPLDGRTPTTEAVATIVAVADRERLERAGLTIEPFGDDELVERILAGCHHEAATERWHAARSLEHAPAPIREDARVAAALRRLVLDPVGMVRDAADWSDETAPGQDAGGDEDAGAPERVTTIRVDGGPTLEIELPAGPADVVVRELETRDDEPGFAPNRMVRTLLKPGDRFLDLGGHVGTFALVAAARGAEVLTVDAHPEHARLLASSAARNGLGDRVRVAHAALAAEEGERELVCSFGWSFLKGDAPLEPQLQPARRVRVPARTVRALLAEAGWDRADLVKMDIEGSEMGAVNGMRELLAAPDAPPVVFEVNVPGLERQGSSVQELLATFEELGYRLLLIDPAEEPLLIPIRPDVFLADASDDVLAIKGDAELRGWKIREPLSRHDQVDRVLQVARSPFRAYRKLLALRLRGAPSWLLDDPLIAEALRALRNDVNDHVREAAGWSAPERAAA